VPKIEELTLPSRIESVEEAAIKAEEFARGQGYGDDHVSAIDLAIRESVANAVKHGNQFDESKTVEIKFISADDRVEITVSDQGTGFDPDEIPDPTEPANLLSACGRGILFMRTFMDVVEWTNGTNGGTTVKMVKKL
jgi:serine/threonine-protein kinase RsbW